MAKASKRPPVVRVKDLPDSPAYNVMLLCPTCAGTYSATRGDYFMANPETVMRCCKQPMVLVEKQTRYVAR